MKKLLGILLGAALLTLTGCGLLKTAALADAEVANFHSLYNAEDFEQIYLKATPGFQASQPKAEILDFFKAVRGKMGKFVSTSRTNVAFNTINGHTTASATYQTVFEHGTGQETFTYVVENKTKFTLNEWNIKADRLMAGASATPATPAPASAPAPTSP